MVVEDSVSVVIKDDTVFEPVAVVGNSVESSFVLEDTVDVESIVVGGVVVKVIAVHFLCGSGVIAVVMDALVFIIQTSLVVCESSVVGAVVVGEDVPPQTVHHTHTVKKK